jgi:hypothetical protein
VAEQRSGLADKARKKHREIQSKPDCEPHVHQLPLLTFWIQSRVLTCDFKHPRIYPNKTDLLGDVTGLN